MMFQYILRRLITAIPVLFGILLVTFALGRLIPGDPCRAILGEKATEEVCARFIQEKGLNEPILTQFGIYVSDMARGNLGESFRLGMPVTRLLIERLPTTFELSLAALVVSMIFGIPLGIISAVKHNSWLDVVTMIWANIGVSMPVFWLGLMLAYVFSLLLKDTPFWLPPSGRVSPGIPDDTFYELWGWVVPETGLWSAFLNFTGRLNILNSLLTQNWELLKDSIKHLILPALALGTIPMAIIARMSRSAMLDVLGQDYIRTARAYGIRQYVVIYLYALKNAISPTLAVIGLTFAFALTGTFFVEILFNWPGLGLFTVRSLLNLDYPAIMGMTLFGATGYVLINLIVDLLQAWIDPRVSLD